MERRSGACGCSDEDVVVIFSSIMQWDVGIFRASPSGGRRSAGGLAEQDLLAFLGDGGAARVTLSLLVGPPRARGAAPPVGPAPPGWGSIHNFGVFRPREHSTIW